MQVEDMNVKLPVCTSAYLKLAGINQGDQTVGRKHTSGGDVTDLFNLQSVECDVTAAPVSVSFSVAGGSQH